MTTRRTADAGEGEGRGRRRWRRPRLTDDRGDVSLEMAIVFPLVIVLTMLVVQVGLWYYAREIALSAARSGVAAGRGHQDSPGKGAARAREVLDRTAGSSLLQADASVSSTADRITIRVTGRAPSLLPFLSGPSVDQSASAPREHWTGH